MLEKKTPPKELTLTKNRSSFVRVLDVCTTRTRNTRLPHQAVSELLAYLASEKNKGSKIDREDVEDLDEAARSVLQGIDDFLKLAPSEDVLMAADQARAQAARPKKAAPAPAPAMPAGGRELEGAVVGEGAFVAGAWIGQQ